jgi:hypothetical protein
VALVARLGALVTPVRLLCFVVAALVAVGPSSLARPDLARAATRVPTTTYTSNTTWSLAASPYVLDGNVTVAAGATLTVEPGVIVKANGQLRTLTVKGTLLAVGTPSARCCAPGSVGSGF